MELGLTQTLDDVKVESDGTVLLPGRLLVDVVRSLPEGEATLALRPEQRDVEITAASARFHLRTLAAEDFPRLPEAEGEVAKLPAAPFAETIERVARAASRDEVRPILTGVLVQAEGSTLTMVATDSYRLSVKHTELEGAALGRADRGERARPRAARAGAGDRAPRAPTRSRSRCRATRRSSAPAAWCSPRA